MGIRLDLGPGIGLGLGLGVGLGPGFERKFVLGLTRGSLGFGSGGEILIEEVFSMVRMGIFLLEALVLIK